MTATFKYIQSEQPELTDDTIVCDLFPNFHIQIGHDGNFYVIKQLDDERYQQMGKYFNRQMAQSRLVYFADNS